MDFADHTLNDNLRYKMSFLDTTLAAIRPGDEGDSAAAPSRFYGTRAGGPERRSKKQARDWKWTIPRASCCERRRNLLRYKVVI
jgi:hypothetical protein